MLIVPFDAQFQRFTPEMFVQDILVKRLAVKEIHCRV